ncbi:fused MFS/spermidine synthase [Bradyrhizobium jicamae]|uniref:fused MFS/spermidine synthase n=1 Tax=Bradyrhizobium jicamae TaxID=280332 RepID=UPI001BA9BF2F|nr:fused MFS/spermidine synthase [Bradyrhizobium jicamae]MBR0938072.1 fused MFS/spermidine synthase [Bradyrhizobium jicamae]
MTPSRSLAPTIYLIAFIAGGVLMGFEMLGSRYLFPYFGGGIGTWASLISTVLCALAVGYFSGSAIVARRPSQRAIGAAIMIAACWLALVPAAADAVMQRILDHIGDGPAATLSASTALLLVPLSLLGTFSPIAVSLLTRSANEAGRVAGLVYGVSTMGNVAGTLLTTFVLIPSIGSRNITYVFAVTLAACAALLLMTPARRPIEV